MIQTAYIVGRPSDELRKLIWYIKNNRLELKYLLAIDNSGILYVVDPYYNQGEEYQIRNEFGFDCS